jgi:hypothetical protein
MISIYQAVDGRPWLANIYLCVKVLLCEDAMLKKKKKKKKKRKTNLEVQGGSSIDLWGLVTYIFKVAEPCRFGNVTYTFNQTNASFLISEARLKRLLSIVDVGRVHETILSRWHWTYELLEVRHVLNDGQRALDVTLSVTKHEVVGTLAEPYLIGSSPKYHVR